MGSSLFGFELELELSSVSLLQKYANSRIYNIVFQEDSSFMLSLVCLNELLCAAKTIPINNTIIDFPMLEVWLLLREKGGREKETFHSKLLDSYVNQNFLFSVSYLI